MHAFSALCMGGFWCDFPAAAKRNDWPRKDHRDTPRWNAQTDHFGSETKFLAQFGAGLEVRFARHVGWTNDLSFGVIDGPRNNFGMFRSGPEFRLLKNLEG